MQVGLLAAAALLGRGLVHVAHGLSELLRLLDDGAETPVLEVSPAIAVVFERSPLVAANTRAW